MKSFGLNPPEYAAKRTDSSTGWGLLDCGRLGSGRIVPLTGGFGSLGGWFKRSRSAGSIPMAMAGRESVSRLINSRCTGAKGNGSALIDVYSTQRIPAIFPDNKNWMEFLIFRYTFLPFATAILD